MELSANNSEKLSQGDLDSIQSNSQYSIENKRKKKAKKFMKVERIGENEEYDQSLLKRRK